MTRPRSMLAVAISFAALMSAAFSGPSPEVMQAGIRRSPRNTANGGNGRGNPARDRRAASKRRNLRKHPRSRAQR